MSIPALLLVFFALAASAHARLNAVILGQPVSVPWLGVALAVLLLALAAAVLWLIRSLLRDGPRLRPHLRTVPSGA